MLTSFTQGNKSPKSPLKPSPFPVLYPISALTLCASSRVANQKCLWNLKAVAQRQPLGLNRAEWRIYSSLERALHGMGVTAEQARRGWGLFSRHNSLNKKEKNWSPYQGFPKTELLPADFSCISSIRHSQLPKPRSSWGKTSGKEKNLGLNMDQKNSSPVVCHRRASHSEFNKGSTWKTKRLSGIRATKAFLKHSLNLKDGSRVPRSSIKITFK